MNTEAALQKFEQARKAAAGGIRDETKRAFVTLKESIDGMEKAFRLQAGEAQLKTLNEGLSKLTGFQEDELGQIKLLNRNLANLAKRTAKVPYHQ